MIAVWIPVTSVPTSSATVAIDTFITELSSVIRNCAVASVRRTTPVAPRAVVEDVPLLLIEPTLVGQGAGGREALTTSTSSKRGARPARVAWQVSRCGTSPGSRRTRTV